MNTTNNSVILSVCSYCPPACETLEIKAEGILCSSSKVDNVSKGDPIGSGRILCQSHHQGLIHLKKARKCFLSEHSSSS